MPSQSSGEVGRTESGLEEVRVGGTAAVTRLERNHSMK